MRSATIAPQPKSQLSPVASAVYGLLAVFSIFYVYITLQSDLLTTTGHEHTVTFFIAHLSFMLPEIFIWALAAMGAVRLKQYAHRVRASADGRAYDYIANALLLLVAYSIAVSVASSIKMVFINSGYQHNVAMVTNHFPIVLILASSLYLYAGAVKLNRLASKGQDNLQSKVVLGTMAGYLVLVITYTWRFLAVADSVKDDDNIRHFFLPVRTLLFTFVLPQAMCWLLGLLACLNLAHFAHSVPGRIYRALLRNLYRGILLVFLCVFAVQFLFITNISTKNFNLGLLLIFAVLAVLIAGFWLIYRGVGQLERLEN